VLETRKLKTTSYHYVNTITSYRRSAAIVRKHLKYRQAPT